MTVDLNSGSQESLDSQRFYAGAVARIAKALWLASACAIPAVWWAYGVPSALGFVAGATVSWINFHFLARGVDGLASRIVDANARESGSTVIGRFLLRYLLVGAIAYGIFVGYPLGFRGFLFGLCMPVAAMIWEAVYETHGAFRRGF